LFTQNMQSHWLFYVSTIATLSKRKRIGKLKQVSRFQSLFCKSIQVP